ncbi:MAG: hypothetical protein ACRDS1_07855 [Pseudonocardiaceae bacterium]
MVDDAVTLAEQDHADQVAFERGAAAPLRTGTLAGDYIRVQRPGTDDTVHVPGELLPEDVAVAVRAAGDGAYDHQAGCWTVHIPAATTERRK